MRRAALGPILLALAALPAAAEETLAAPIAQCIKADATKVEAAIPDLNRAVDFLVADLCAEPVADEQARQNKRAMDQQQAHWKKMCDEEQAEARKKPADAGKSDQGWCGTLKFAFTGQSAVAPGAGEDDEAVTSYTIFAGSRPSAAVALAAQLLLDLRLSHGKPQ